MTAVDWVLLARLVRPQGRKGEIIAEIFTDFPDRFKQHPKVFLTNPKATSSLPQETLIEKHWLHQGRVVLKFKGIDSINDAETLRGLHVVVPAEERVPLADDAVYIDDLVGCHLFDNAAGTAIDLGQIVDVERQPAPAPDLLVVKPRPSPTAAPDGKRVKPEPLLIPFAKNYLVSIDVEQKRITMHLPAGLADLNQLGDGGESEG